MPGIAMLLTVKIPLTSADGLLSRLENFNEACEWASEIAFSEKLFSWLPLQRRIYRECRNRFCTTAAQTTMVVRKVAHTYRDKTRRKTQAHFKSHGGMPLYTHSYKRTGTILIYGVRYPIHNWMGQPLSAKHEGRLVFHDGRFYAQQAVDVPEGTPIPVAEYLGCDLGIANILADSDGVVYAGNHLNSLRHRYYRLRKRLQPKGTKSAKRLLRRRRSKESRFSRDVNHCISKKVVTKARDTGRGIALEELGGIRDRIKVRRAQRRQHHSWAFAQLRAFVEYKAKRDGVPVVAVDPRNTSRTCPKCGHIAKENRKTRDKFQCVSCGLAGPADTIAAVNIAERAMTLGRVAGFQPNAAPARNTGVAASREGSVTGHGEGLVQ